ncbi:UvrD-helicase domain-containing protein [Altibacter sp.]|uniref:UvrD-helicase domain-containing protein n=1 Tax=Altibacter sp. TaxID=2024823 RepID=UPI0025BCB844|nr:UvrD-helicase domain-containing protein [Altibacter sp.]
MQDHSFTIYDASAGSGKTFTLVKEYLKKLLLSKNEGYYAHLLAITFTNKAVAEMKERIIDNLIVFAAPEAVASPSEMLLQIAKETKLTVTELNHRASNILTHLLHHYAGFNVVTIDRFNHQLLRTFARDLKLPQNFEVSLEVGQLLSEAVDQLIAKAGKDALITKVLLDFALEKIDDDKSWDIAKDIALAAQIIINENDAPHVAKLKDKSLADFNEFKKRLLVKQQKVESALMKAASEVLQLIEESGLQFDDFNRGSLPKHFQKLADKDHSVSWDAKWQEELGEKPLYPSRVLKDSPEIIPVIEAIAPKLTETFITTKQQVHEYLLLSNIIQNITPLSVINLVNQELSEIKEDRGLLPISEFNSLIYNEIKDQPAPFIYERLGEKYRHFFIDEFQDTSAMQWRNLIPLIDNALSQQTVEETTGTLLLVGDAKQSIYRWRGGLPEQFIQLYNNENPFAGGMKNVLSLDTNYRSCKNIITFNNAFFSYIADFLGEPSYANLYRLGNNQKNTLKDGGLIQFEFIEAQNKEEEHELYGAKVLETIQQVQANGFLKEEICVLTRTRKQGVAVAAYLMEREIPVVSSETLLLATSPVVQCLVNTLTLHLHPSNEEVKVALLHFLYEHFKISEEKHRFFTSLLRLDTYSFEKKLAAYGISFNFKAITSLSLYESCEYIIKKFELASKDNGYLFGFMDLIFEFQQQPQAGKASFLSYWDTKKETAGLPASNGAQAVQIMTIHKSKGLEFPVVIFPYADVDLYAEQNAKTWYPWEDDQFDEVYINFKKEVAAYPGHGAALYEERRNTLELDNINLLYVTLTRAIEQLYVFTTPSSVIKEEGPTKFNQLFTAFLKAHHDYNETSSIVTIGSPNRYVSRTAPHSEKTVAPSYPVHFPEEHDLVIVSRDASLWGTEAAAAISIGNLLHDTMSKVKTHEDVEIVFEEMGHRSVVPPTQIDLLLQQVKEIVTHPELEHLYAAGQAQVITERDIITQEGELMRPDRLNIYTNNSVSLVDYKTGSPLESHAFQLQSYASALEAMQFEVAEKLLVYISETGILVNKL